MLPFASFFFAGVLLGDFDETFLTENRRLHARKRRLVSKYVMYIGSEWQ